MQATSLPAAGMQTFAAEAPMSGPFDIDLPVSMELHQSSLFCIPHPHLTPASDVTLYYSPLLQAMKSVERVSSGINAYPSGPTPQPVGHGTNNPAMKNLQLQTGLTLRQESLEALASGELTRSKMGGSQTLFADVLEQVSC
jgi:hypothetical protein